MNAINYFSKLTVLLFLCISFANCENNQTIYKNTNEIISVIINDEYDSYFNIPQSYNKKIDTSRFLINGRFIVVINPEMYPISKTFGLNKHKDKYQNLFNKLSLIKDSKNIKLEDLNVNEGISLLKLNNNFKEHMKQNTDYKDFHIFVSFSRVAFNDKRNQAIVAVRSSTSSLAGSYDLCFFKKENGVWKIIDFQNIWIS